MTSTEDNAGVRIGWGTAARWRVRSMWRSISARLRFSRSQFGQDRWVYHEMFRRMRNGFFLDVGATDGYHINNTYLLEKKYGWNGICIEADPMTFAALRINRRCTCLNLCVDGVEHDVDFVLSGDVGGIIGEELDNRSHDDARASGKRIVRMRTRTLASILRAHRAPARIDYFSLDIEGAEERVLVDFPFAEYVFNTLTIERPSPRVHRRLQDAGYMMLNHIPAIDSFYMHESYLPTFFTRSARVPDAIRARYMREREAFFPSAR